jgi:DNA polymerase-3 subunit delta
MPIQLYFGDDEYSLHQAVARLRREGGFEDVDVLRFEGPTLNFAELLAAVATAGFFASQRLVIVRNLSERLRSGRRPKSRAKGAAGEELSLRVLAESIAESTTLLLLEVGARGDAALIREARQLAKERPQMVQVREFAAPRPREMPRWLQARAVELGVRLRPKAAEALVAKVGAQPTLASTELAKLASAVPPGGTITRELVDELVVKSVEETIFPLVDAVAGGRRDRALALLERQAHQLSSSSNVDLALYIIRLLARQFRLLLQIRLLGRDGTGRDEIIERLKLSSYFADTYFAQARRFSVDQLTASLERLAQLEYTIKHGEATPASLELLLVELVPPPRSTTI